MYEKNLVADLRLRLCQSDMDFLRDLAEVRFVSVSEVIRSIIGEYRRGMQSFDALSHAIDFVLEKGETLSHGDTKTDFND